METLLEDLTVNLRERIQKKIRDVNRTLSYLTAARVKSIDVDGVHSLVFRRAFPDLSQHCVIRDLSSLVSFFLPRRYVAFILLVIFVLLHLFNNARRL